MYMAPTISKIGGFNELTNGAGSYRNRDLLGFRALVVIYHPW